MTPLMIDDSVKAAIAKVVAFADSHRLDTPTMQALVRGEGECPGDNPNRIVLVPFGFRCVFTVEQQPFGWARHLSVSVVSQPDGSFIQKPAGGDCTVRSRVGRVPNQHAMRMLMDEFGMTKPFEQCIVHLDEVNKCGAINVIEPIGDSIHDGTGTTGSGEKPQEAVGGDHGDGGHPPDDHGTARG